MLGFACGVCAWGWRDDVAVNGGSGAVSGGESGAVSGDGRRGPSGDGRGVRLRQGGLVDLYLYGA